MWLRAKVETKWATTLLPTDDKDNGTLGTLNTDTFDEIVEYLSDGNDEGGLEGEAALNVSHDGMRDDDEDELWDDNADGADKSDLGFEDIVVLEGDPLVSLLRAITLTLSLLSQNNDC